MRKVVLILTVIIVCTFTMQARSHEEREALWNEANTLYLNGDYNGAIAVYEAIAEDGFVSSKLYYNLGNAYFKANSIGKAIVNYNRAQRLAPYDKDIEYNLAVANSYVKDRIDTVPDFFLNNWTRSLRTTLSSNVWAVISVISFAAVLAFVLVYMLARKKGLRKAGFFTALVLTVMFIVSLSFSVAEKKKLIGASDAIVTSSAASVKSSPDSASKDLFILHEGTKVEVLNKFGTWTEIMIADGNKGWITGNALELVD